ERYWDFGDGETSTDVSPVHLYNKPGAYNVKLKVRGGDIGSQSLCDSEFTQFAYIVVDVSPVARFLAHPEYTTISTPKIKFEDRSTAEPGAAYSWNFGDWNLK